MRYTYALRRAEREHSPALGAHCFTLRRQIHDAYRTRFNLVNLLDGAGNLRFRRARGHGESVDAFLGHDERLLREPWCANNLMGDSANGRYRAGMMRARDHAFFSFFSFFLVPKIDIPVYLEDFTRARSVANAASGFSMMRYLCVSTATGLRLRISSVAMPCRLWKLFIAFCSWEVSATRTEFANPCLRAVSHSPHFQLPQER